MTSHCRSGVRVISECVFATVMCRVIPYSSSGVADLASSRGGEREPGGAADGLTDSRGKRGVDCGRHRNNLHHDAHSFAHLFTNPSTNSLAFIHVHTHPPTHSLTHSHPLTHELSHSLTAEKSASQDWSPRARGPWWPHAEVGRRQSHG